MSLAMAPLRRVTPKRWVSREKGSESLRAGGTRIGRSGKAFAWKRLWREHSGALSSTDPTKHGLRLCLFSGLVIVLHWWACRFSMNPDGVSYLDMTDLRLRG